MAGEISQELFSVDRISAGHVSQKMVGLVDYDELVADGSSLATELVSSVPRVGRDKCIFLTDLPDDLPAELLLFLRGERGMSCREFIASTVGKFSYPPSHQ